MRALVVCALSVVACGQAPTQKPGPASAGCSSDCAPDSGQITTDVPDASPPVDHASCWPDSTDGLAPCADGVGEGTRCNGSSSDCVSVTDSGVIDRYTCPEPMDAWTRVIPVSTPCEDRTDECAATSRDGGLSEFDLLSALLGNCGIGGESWLLISLADGCATSFALSDPDPTHLGCMMDALSSRRYACVSGPVCISAVSSTLH
jgi:hypothetical protein